MIGPLTKRSSRRDRFGSVATNGWAGRSPARTGQPTPEQIGSWCARGRLGSGHRKCSG